MWIGVKGIHPVDEEQRRSYRTEGLASHTLKETIVE